MLRQLAKIARTPPSPKNSAWMMSATLTAMTAAHGPSTIAISVPPTPCAVVPPGTGTLNIMIVKLSAEKMASSGIVRLFEDLLDALRRDRPGGHRDDAEAERDDGAEVAVGDVHRGPLLLQRVAVGAQHSGPTGCGQVLQLEDRGHMEGW